MKRAGAVCGHDDVLYCLQIDGRKIRIDYSVTKRAHSPTPGNYQGFLPKDSRRFGGGGGGGGKAQA